MTDLKIILLSACIGFLAGLVYYLYRNLIKSQKRWKEVFNKDRSIGLGDVVKFKIERDPFIPKDSLGKVIDIFNGYPVVSFVIKGTTMVLVFQNTFGIEKIISLPEFEEALVNDDVKKGNPITEDEFRNLKDALIDIKTARDLLGE